MTASALTPDAMWSEADRHQSIARRTIALLLIADEIVDGTLTDMAASILLCAIVDSRRPPRMAELVAAVTMQGKLRDHGADFAYDAPAWVLIEHPEVVGDNGKDVDYDQYATQLEDAWSARARQIAVKIATEATK